MGIYNFKKENIMAQTELHINVVDMEAEILEFARAEILAVFEQFKEEKRIADELTKKLYNKYRGSWNCIVGKNFGSHVVHMTKAYLFATYGEEISGTSILLWKTE